MILHPLSESSNFNGLALEDRKNWRIEGQKVCLYPPVLVERANMSPNCQPEGSFSGAAGRRSYGN